MNGSLLKKLKFYVIKLFLEILLFIDFLEAFPIKATKIFIKAGSMIFIIAIVTGFIVIESKTRTVHNLLSYTLFYSAPTSTVVATFTQPKLLETSPDFPQITARSYIVVDLKRQQVLREYNSKTPLPPASTTKIMTALVARDVYNLTDKLKIPEECTKTETQRVGFVVDDEITVEDLLGALLVNSAGDAACALANGKGAYDEFITLMNLKAINLGLVSTNFSNPIGLDDFSENHLISAYDLYKLTLALRRDPILREYVKMHEYSISSGKALRIVPNTNVLLWEVPGSVGIKTGKTYGAGEVLVYEYAKDNINLLIVIMGSLDRFKDTKAILNWTLASY